MNKWDKKYFKWRNAYAVATKKKTDKAWAKFHRLDRQLYRYQQKRWEKEWLPYVQNWHPYGAFLAVPMTLIMMVERCNLYWQEGFNVHVIKEEVMPIRESVTKAYEMAHQLREMLDSGTYLDDYAAYRKLIQDFFTYVGSVCDDWGD